MASKKYDPNEPMMQAIARLKLKPFFSSNEVRRRAENDPMLMEVGLMDAYAILRNGGCKNQAEIDEKGGAQ